MTDDILNPEERDVPLEPRLQDAARAYNPPPATPREAMWAKIAAARAAATPESRGAEVTPAPVAPETRVISIDAARARRRPTRTWAILAGTLAAGIALGVFGGKLWHADQGPAQVAAANDETKGPLSGPVRPPTGPIAPQRATTGGEQVAVLPGAGEAARPDVRTPGATSAAATSVGGRPPKSNMPRDRQPDVTPRTRGESPAPNSPNALYAAAAVQTLTQAEALLVAWRVDAPRDTAAARQLGGWARDVLGSTRLLLDSPAASDPRLHDLLDDLELVLAQIVQLSGAPLTDEERALLERSVKARDLLPRIRSAVPAGITAAAST